MAETMLSHHTGGVVGLKSNEALTKLQIGEEVLTKETRAIG